MDSSPVLRQQSQNKIRCDIMRTKNEQNKMAAQPKSSKFLNTPHLSNQNIENRDPGNSEMGQKAPVRPGVSRLPVLAKSHRLQTPSDFSRSHCRWEEKPLAGKTKKKRPCTRPVPFNFSQPKSSRMTTENQQPLTASQSRPSAVQTGHNVCSTRLNPLQKKAKPAEHPAVLNRSVGSTKSTMIADGNSKENSNRQWSGQPKPSNTMKTSATSANPLSSITDNAMNQTSTTTSAKPALSGEACLDNMSLLSLKDPAKTSQTSQNMKLSTHVTFSKSSTEKEENFQSDHAALLSILRNEGVKTTELGSATPQSNSCKYLPQRVSVMKSRQKVGTNTGPVKSVQFSPDPAALQSILLNDGVKVGGPACATPRNSVCPSGRGTSIYTAQRVPLRKNQATGGAAALAVKTPLKTWTPQRVRDTRHQPMSAQRWHMSKHKSPFIGTPELHSLKVNSEVVQRLLYEQEEEQNTNVTEEEAETRAEQLSVHVTPPESHSEETVRGDDVEEQQQQRIVGEQPFIQAPQRESVIFFSTGKTLLRAPRFEKPESSTRYDQRGPMLPTHEELSSVSGCKLNPSVHSLQRDFITQKTCAPSPAVAMLRKRFPPLEELRLDEEVASYTAVSVLAAPKFLPSQPRCGNPLASILHSQDSFSFIPIGLDLSSDCTSPPQER